MKSLPCRHTARFALAIAACWIMAPAQAGLCPAIGYNTDCGAIIDVGAAKSTVTLSGQGPYDGIDDTLVGIVNHSKTPIHAVGLRSSRNIFGFDGDGIVGYGSAGSPADSSGYAGPNIKYSNINAAATSGVVNFLNPLGTGASAYFGLENALAKSISVSDVVNNALTVTTSGPTISATFTPNLGLSLAEAATDIGFVDFDWVQIVTGLPDPSPYFTRSGTHLTSASAPFNDPPSGGGYTFQPAPDNSYPFYYDPKSGELASHQTADTLSFGDRPTDPCLDGGHSAGVAGCNGKNAAPGSFISFNTELAGILADGSAVDLGVGFKWTSDFNGTAGGVAVTKNDLPIDPGSGFGGVTLLDLDALADFSNTDIFIDSINGMPPAAFFALDTATVPAPGSLANLALGLALLTVMALQRQRRQAH